MTIALTIKASYNKKCYRTFTISGKASLYDLGEAIVAVFDFEFDHSFGFYDNIKRFHDSIERYTLFADIDDIEYDPSYGKTVEKTKIKDVFFENKKMLFLFDYGDEWEFILECLKREEIKGQVPKRIIDRKGESPAQYPFM